MSNSGDHLVSRRALLRGAALGLAGAGMAPARAAHADALPMDAVASGPDRELIELRRDPHRHPELAGQERRTASVVAGRLRAAGLDVTTGVGRHGVVAVLADAHRGRRRARGRRGPRRRSPRPYGRVPGGHGRGAAGRAGRGRHAGSSPVRARCAHCRGRGRGRGRGGGGGAGAGTAAPPARRHRDVRVPARRGVARRRRRDARRRRVRPYPPRGDPRAALRSLPGRRVRRHLRGRAARPGPRRHRARRRRCDGAGGAARRRDRRARHGLSSGHPREPRTARGRPPAPGRAVDQLRLHAGPGVRR